MQRVDEVHEEQPEGQAAQTAVELSKYFGFGLHLEVILLNYLLSPGEQVMHLPVESQIKQS